MGIFVTITALVGAIGIVAMPENRSELSLANTERALVEQYGEPTAREELGDSESKGWKVLTYQIDPTCTHRYQVRPDGTISGRSAVGKCEGPSQG